MGPLKILLFFIAFVCLGADYPRPPINVQLGDENVEIVGGLRPYRTGGIRIEREDRPQLTIIHNYGHGGAGLTLSWGSAMEAVEMAEDLLPQADRIVIIGAGIMGLTTALLLTEAGYEPFIYAEKFPYQTVSAVAGGLFNPVGVSLENFSEDQADRVLERSIERITTLSQNKKTGVKAMPLFIITSQPEHSYSRRGGLGAFILRGLMEPPVFHQRLPIEGVELSGLEYQTFLIDTPVYLRWIYGRIKKKTDWVRMKIRSFNRFKSNQDQNNLVFNCAGLGAQTLSTDPNLIPVKGNLVRVKRKKATPLGPNDFLLGGRGYLFARQGEWVLGGSYQEGVKDPSADPEVCEQILEQHRKNFGY